MEMLIAQTFDMIFLTSVLHFSSVAELFALTIWCSDALIDVHIMSQFSACPLL